VEEPRLLPDGGALLEGQRARGAANAERSFGARPGALGDTVGCRTAVGREAAVGAADSGGRLTRYVPEMPAEPSALLRRCPLTAVAAHPVSGPDRRASARRLDAEVAAVDRARPPGSLLLVVGIADLSAPPHLHPVVADGPGYDGGWLTSASTGRAPYLQLLDVAPTALSALGLDAPDVMVGQPARTAAGRPADLVDAVRELADANAVSVAQHPLVPRFLLALVLLDLLLLGAAAVLLRRAARAETPDSLHPPAPPGARLLAGSALAVAALPAGSYLADLVPWWRSPAPGLTQALAVLLAAGALCAAALLGPWRRRPTGPVAALAGLSALVLGLDVLTGSHLQLDAVAGYSPLVAGRFSGFGNLAFGVFAAGALLAAGCLTELGGTRSGRVAVVGAVGLLALAVVGAPQWGNDVGGVLALSAAFGVVCLRTAGARLTVLRVAAILVAGAAVVGALGVADAARPAEQQTHLGRFVGQLRDGTAGIVLRRKAEANLGLLDSPLTLLVLGAALFVALLLYGPWSGLRRALALHPGARTGLVGALTVAVVGAAVNDSGIAVSAFVAAAAVPLALVLALGPAGAGSPVPPTLEPSPRRPAPSRRWAHGAATVLAVLPAVLLPVLPIPAGTRAAVAAPPRTQHVVVVGVAGLRWDDVSQRSTPTLAGLAARGSVAALSVRAAPGVTCPGEGWLTLGAGTYAALEDPGATKPARGCGARGPEPVTPDGVGGLLPTFPGVVRLNDALRFGAAPGLLGDRVRCTVAMGPGAALAAADTAGRVDRYLPVLPADPAPLLAGCPLTVVDLGTVPASDRGAAAAPGSPRGSAVRAADDLLGAVERALPPDAVLVVGGVSETTADDPRLHVAVVSGPGFGAGWLRSGSTRRLPYVQLADLAPTALDLLGAEVPGAVAGRPLRGTAPGRPASLDATVERLVDADVRARSQRAAVGPFFVGLAAASLLVLGAVVLALRRDRPGPAAPRGRRLLAGAAVALAAVPACTFLGNLVPWWRAPVPPPWRAVPLAVVVAVLAAAVAALALAGPGRRRPGWSLAVVGAVSAAVVALDAATGSRLQIDSLLGYNPLVAGRFTGIGNIAFAVLGTGAVLLAAALATARRPGGGGRGRAAAAVAAVGVPLVVVDGAPPWGADFGGVLTLVPALAAVALLAGGTRITAARLALAGLSGAALVAVVSVVDWLRPADSRSHFGRFVASVADGSAGGTVERKLLTNLDLLLAGPHTVGGLLAVVALVVVVLRPPAALREAYEAVPSLRPGLVGVVVLGLVGAATNDSGVAVPVVAGSVALPLALAVCLRVAGGERDAAPRSLPAAGRGDTREGHTREGGAGAGGGAGGPEPDPDPDPDRRPAQVLP